MTDAKKTAKEIAELTPEMRGRARVLYEKLLPSMSANMQDVLRKMETTASRDEMRTLALSVLDRK